MQVSSRDATIAKQKLENHERPIAPSTHKRTILVGVARNGPPAQSTLTISHGEFAEMKADLSWTRYGTFKVSIDRVNQGRVAVLDGVDQGFEWSRAHFAECGRVRPRRLHGAASKASTCAARACRWPGSASASRADAAAPFRRAFQPCR